MRITGHLRVAVRRHPHLADATIALAVFAAAVLTTFAGHSAATVRSDPAALGAAVAACGALAVRRRWPLSVLLCSAGAAEMLLVQVNGAGVLILLAPSIALYTVADMAERRTGLIAGGSVLAVLVIVHAQNHPGLLGPDNLAFAALGALAIAAGDASRSRRAYLAEVEQRAERAAREREQDAHRRIAEERLRIARDLHDSVGHHLAVISVQSEVAGRAIERDGAAREALVQVKSASRKALDELRDTVGLLRQPGDPVAPTGIPAPGLEALDDLLASLRATGLEIDARFDGTAPALAPATGLTAYRVIQESLTNVCKHSAARQACLTLAYGRHQLCITVDNASSGMPMAPSVPPEHADGAIGTLIDGGHGIAGMRERVLALGGRFSAGPRPGGAFRVAAVLPYQPLDLVSELVW